MDDLTAIKNWDVRDLNHALMAAIMAQQLERDRQVGAQATTTRPLTPTTPSSTEGTMRDKIINQIVTGSVFILLEVLMIVSYVILINHNRIDYRKRMIYILILICTRKLTLSIIPNKMDL